MKEIRLEEVTHEANLSESVSTVNFSSKDNISLEENVDVSESRYSDINKTHRASYREDKMNKIKEVENG